MLILIEGRILIFRDYETPLFDGAICYSRIYAWGAKKVTIVDFPTAARRPSTADGYHRLDANNVTDACVLRLLTGLTARDIP